MNIKKIYSPFQKIDEQADGTIIVIGIASTEAVDSQGEVIMASAMKNALPDFFKYGTGNLREMHQPLAAGTVDKADTVDGITTIEVTVVDPIAVKKVLAGVYKGFSIGGGVISRDKVNKSIITAMRLTEISLVDRPANPEATFNVFKADGLDEGDAIAKTDDTIDAQDTIEGDADISKADEPIDAQDADASDSDADMEEPPALEFSDAEKADKAIEDLANILNKGDVSAERLVELANADNTIAKGMGGIAELAYMLKNIRYLVQDQQGEADREGDGSFMPDRLRGWLLSGAEILALMTAEELGELVATVTPDASLPDGAIALAESTDGLEKAGARNSKADSSKIQTVHDHAVELGATCGAEKADMSDDLNKIETQVTLGGEIIKFAVTKDVADIIGKMADRIVTLEAMPTVGKAFLNAVAITKSQDMGGTETDEPAVAPITKADGNVDAVATLIKGIHAQGGQVIQK